jgi:alpha-mannosidase
VLRATVVRATRYANDVKIAAHEQPWRPAVDAGELRFNFLLSPGDERLPILAQQLEQPPLALMVAPAPGALPRRGSLAALEPTTLKLLALKMAEDGKGWILRLQETSGRDTVPQLIWLGRKLRLSLVKGHRMATWRLVFSRGRWQATSADVSELRPRR